MYNRYPPSLWQVISRNLSSDQAQVLSLYTEFGAERDPIVMLLGPDAPDPIDILHSAVEKLGEALEQSEQRREEAYQHGIQQGHREAGSRASPPV